MNQEAADKYQSVKKWINLPPTRRLRQPEETIFNVTKPPQNASPAIKAKKRIVEPNLLYLEGDDEFVAPDASGEWESGGQNSSAISQRLYDAELSLVKQIHDSLVLFNNPSDFKFIFPDSKFEDVPPGQTNSISYEQKIMGEEEDTFKARLSPEHISQIAEKGEFEVKSANETAMIPYVWKINDVIFRGAYNRREFWYNGLSWCCATITSTAFHLLGIIPEQLKMIIGIPGRFYSLIFGRRKLRAVYTPNYQQEVFIDFWSDVMQNELKDQEEFGGKFLEKLYLPFLAANYATIESGLDIYETERRRHKQEESLKAYNTEKNRVDSFKSQIRSVENQFNNNWQKIKKRVLSKATAEYDDAQMSRPSENEEEPFSKDLSKRDQAILEKFEEEKFTLYEVHLKTHLAKLKDMTLPAIEALVMLVSVFSIIDAKLKLKDQRISEARERYRQGLKKKHYIRHRDYKFLDRRMKKQFGPIEQKMKSDFFETFMADPAIRNRLPEKYVSIYQKYLRMCADLPQLIEEKKKTLKSLYQPARIFYSTYMLLPPFEVQKNQSGYYSQKRHVGMQIDTSKDFWKLRLYGMRIKCWTINCVVSLISMAWVGPFGLKCLLWFDQFKYDEHVDYYSGGVLPQMRKTFVGVFRKVLEGIKKSREDFERTPDRGLLGKNISRYYNYLQCYVFRLLIVGILGVLIIYPILIVVLSLLCIVLTVTFWVWVPLIMVVCYIFNILVFQFESSSIPSGVLIRSVPLLSLAFIVIASIFRLLWAIILMILVPIICALYTLFLILQRGFRTLTDAIMLLVFSKLGRTPSRNTAIAKKISGPGMSRNYFYSINEEDVYVLTQAALEKLFFIKLANFTREEIGKPLSRYNAIMNYVLSAFGYATPSHSSSKNWNLISNNWTLLINTFNTQVSYYMARFPKNPYNVRFTQEEIDCCFQNSKKIVQNFVEKNEIKGWIFDEFNVLYEDYDELTRHIWLSIFGCGESIFEPLEKIDSRFKLEDVIQGSNSGKMKKSVHSVKEALDGEIDWASERRVRFSPAQNSLLSKDSSYNFVGQIIDYHSMNSESSVNTFVEFPQTILVPHQNLGELKKINAQNMAEARRNNPRIIVE